jgi:hypothetical protein
MNMLARDADSYNNSTIGIFPGNKSRPSETSVPVHLIWCRSAPGKSATNIGIEQYQRFTMKTMLFIRRSLLTIPLPDLDASLTILRAQRNCSTI